jgi:hypothetical protein
VIEGTGAFNIAYGRWLYFLLLGGMAADMHFPHKINSILIKGAAAVAVVKG